MRKYEQNPFYRRITLGFLMFLGLWLIVAVLLPAQTIPQSTSSTIDLQTIRPSLASLGQAISSVNINSWKAPDTIKSVARNDLSSISADLNDVLPGLLQTAEASPSSLKASFEVYRNINALYDVVLRISQAANFTGSNVDAASLSNALNELGRARKSLSDSLLTVTSAKEEELTKLRASLTTPAQPANSQGQKKVIVNDGPESSSKKSKSHRTTTPNN